MTKLTKAIHSVLAVAIFAAATAQAEEPKIKINVRVRPALVMADLSIQLEKASFAAQVRDDLLSGAEKFAQGATSVAEINLDPTTMGMLGNNHGHNADLARKLDFMVIRSYTYDKPGMYRTEDVDLFRKKLEDGSWSCPVHMRSISGSSDICSRSAADHETNEMVIISIRPQKITFIHLSGKMSLNDLNQLSYSAGGLTHR